MYLTYIALSKRKLLGGNHARSKDEETALPGCSCFIVRQLVRYLHTSLPAMRL